MQGPFKRQASPDTTISFMGGLLTFLVEGSDTAGRYTLAEYSGTERQRTARSYPCKRGRDIICRREPTARVRWQREFRRGPRRVRFPAKDDSARIPDRIACGAANGCDRAGWPRRFFPRLWRACHEPRMACRRGDLPATRFKPLRRACKKTRIELPVRSRASRATALVRRPVTRMTQPSKRGRACCKETRTSGKCCDVVCS
ncbi:hypothetical protein V1294_006847 [Bradyrhizobium sp. AZCC 1678]